VASGDSDDVLYNPSVDDHFVPGEAWKEGAVKTPAYPEQDNLLYFPVDAGDSRFKFAVDGKSLSVGEDRVVRFSVVIESTTGVQNTMFEGIRCATGEYKIYAYGTSDKKFVDAKRSKWKPIEFGVSGSMAYRRQLHTYFFCSANLPLKQAEIIQRLKYDADRVSSDTIDW
jgi:hypothetical protein